MADNVVAELDRRERGVQTALRGADGGWSDSRRESVDRRYIGPQAEAHDLLHGQLNSVGAASTEARAAARDTGLAVAGADREGALAERHIAEAHSSLAEAHASSQAGFGAEASATQGHDRTVGLARDANSTAP